MGIRSHKRRKQHARCLFSLDQKPPPPPPPPRAFLCGVLYVPRPRRRRRRSCKNDFRLQLLPAGSASWGAMCGGGVGWGVEKQFYCKVTTSNFTNTSWILFWAEFLTSFFVTCGEADRSRHGKCCSSSCCCCCWGDHFHFTSLMYTQKGCEKKKLCQKIGVKKENFFQKIGVKKENFPKKVCKVKKFNYSCVKNCHTCKRRRSVKGSLSCCHTLIERQFSSPENNFAFLGAMQTRNGLG